MRLIYYPPLHAKLLLYMAFCGHVTIMLYSCVRKKATLTLAAFQLFVIMLDYLRRRECRPLTERLPDRFPGALPELVSRGHDNGTSAESW